MIEYSTKRIAPNNTEYQFLLQRVKVSLIEMSVITVVRVHSSGWRGWVDPYERLLLRCFYDPIQALQFFEHLLSVFPRDALYKEA